MMKKYILFGIGLLFLLSGSAASAEEPLLTTEYSHRRYTSQDGLPSMIMQRIYKDSKGFLWQGTLKGASCFDGLNFKPYIFANMMNIDRIEEINGEIRFMWNSDLLYPETQKSVHLTDTLSFNPHNSYSLPPNYYIFDNNEGKKYFVTVKDDTISEVICIPQLQGLYMCKTYLDLQQNTLYIPNNRDKKVFIYNFQNKHVQIMENIVMESFIQHSRLGLLGIGRDGIYRIDGDKATLYVPLKFEMQNKIAKETKNGDIYIMDFYNVYRISNKKVEHLYHNSELTLWDMTLDNDGNLWLATNKGLYNFFHFDFNNYQIPNHKIRSVAQDSDGIYWFAGDNEDIFSMSDGVLKPVNYPLNHALQTVSFNSVFSFNNITYFLIRGGILIHENRRFYWADLPSGNQYYSNMAEYGKNLLVTGSDMIFEITPQGKIVKTLSAEALKQSGYLGLAVDKNNRIIAGGDDGISIVENDKVTFLKSDFTCFSDIVCVNSQNHIFSTSHKHLNLVKDDTVITIRSFDNDYIMALLPVDADNLIISTLKGFYIFSTKAYFERDAIEMLFYNRDNGMDAIEPAFSETVLDKEGKVWMITTEKVVNFDPEKLLRQTSAPSLTVRNCAVSKDNVNWENIADFANSSFAYYNDNIRFSFIGLNYSAAENVRYRYR
ncbi:MAG: hypothetical protein LBR10_11675, partial [Prevotellaceae bacterium]|nr:hypothetical protein [Prevotellaceae bacterium]